MNDILRCYDYGPCYVVRINSWVKQIYHGTSPKCYLTCLRLFELFWHLVGLWSTLVEELLRLLPPDEHKYASQALSKPWFPLPKVDPACSVMVDCQDIFLAHYFDFRLMPSSSEEREEWKG